MCAKKLTATKAFAALLLAGICSLAMAGQVAGTVINLSGPLMAQKADGKVKVLALRSEVESGDTLVSEKNTYAQIKFIDNSEITLKPNTTFKVEAFAFDAGKPEGDSASFNLVKGGLRSITGLLGKRNKEKFQLKTPTATIGIRGTTFVAEYIPASAEPALAMRYSLSSVLLAGQIELPVQLAQLAPGKAPGLPTVGLQPGLHVFVIDGMIQLNNGSGSNTFTAGQFGYVRNTISPPILVPANPALKFTPPPTFAQISAPGPNNTSPPKPDAIDCEVR
jgi:hypothetical protein